jgi:hypothetical protein
MVESSTAKAAEMALKLHTVHRWWGAGVLVQGGLAAGKQGPAGPARASLPHASVFSHKCPCPFFLASPPTPSPSAWPPNPPPQPLPLALRCVTGTPLSRGLEDLFGLLAFLQAAPFDSHHWWLRVLQRPYEAGSRAGESSCVCGCARGSYVCVCVCFGGGGGGANKDGGACKRPESGR